MPKPGPIYFVKMTIRDKDGAVDSHDSQIVVDPFVATGASLLFGGTSRADRIVVKAAKRSKAGRAKSTERIQVLLNGRVLGVFSTRAIITIYGGDGNDRIEIAKGLNLRASFDGGAGKDTLIGGDGNDTLLGRRRQ